MNARIIIQTATLFVGVWVLSTVAGAALPETSCTRCHGDAELFDEAGVAVVHGFAVDVHGKAGLSCEACHGGNPDLSAAEDMEAAMDPGFAANPYRGAPPREVIPGFCGRCHSDPSYMKRFRPDFRVDQEAEYRTSHHGKALQTGDDDVATCVSCHGVHGILSVKDPESPVYPTRVAETCRSCHADAGTMAGHTLDGGGPIPVDQYERWLSSVHAAALLVKGDLSAPTCNDCHGNHGATPPGVESVSLVCGQCHGREAALFRASPKREGFREHNEILAGADAGCRDCHEAPDPAAGVGLDHFSECATCHGNHDVFRPTVAILGSLPASPCAFCHEGDGQVAEDEDEPQRIQEHYAAELSRLLGEAPEGLDRESLYDWLVDRALELPMHTVASGDLESRGTALRPEFGRLFQKFRIGKTRHSYGDPESGGEAQVRVVQCGDCHGAETGEGVGLQTALVFLKRMHELTVEIARAERVLLAARRGGVEVNDALLDLDMAVDTQVELEALVHTFDADTSGEFVHKQIEGVEHARAALMAGRAGLSELSNRRRGLTVALGLILVLLVGLGVKIRWMDQPDS